MANKYYRNPQRDDAKKIRPYVPQYVVRGLKPEAIASATIPETFERVQQSRHAPVKVYDNPRTRPAPSIGNGNVPYAEIPKGPSPIGLGPLPNIGNNIENTWAYADGEVFDDMSDEPIAVEELDPNQEMIDNNDDDPHNYSNIPQEITPRHFPVGYRPEKAPRPKPRVHVQLEEQAPVVQTRKTDYEYVLLVHGEVLSTGFKDDIEEEVTALVYGEHYLCESSNVTPDDITVLKKVKIKIGVFIDN